MPGLFGGIGCADGRVYGLLRAAFEEIWGGSEALEGPGWAIGAHAFAGKTALRKTDRSCYAVDGAYSVYAHPAGDSSAFSYDFRIQDDVIRLGTTFMGNVAGIDGDALTLHLAVESSGTFPLYITHHDGGILFSSHLLPLARITRPAVDPIAMLEFLRAGFTFAGRSIYSGIQRLLAGQSIRYDAVRRVVEVQETSRAWVAAGGGEAMDITADISWRLLGEAVRDAVPTRDRIGLMLSAGWDSRTLLAALSDRAPDRLVCYSHGDPASRELRIAARLSDACGAEWHSEPIDQRVLRLEDLKHGFRRFENVVFPHWHRAGRLLARMGAACGTAGVYGEIMGGHYGPSTRVSGGRRTLSAVANSLFQRKGHTDDREIAQRSAESLLHVPPLKRHWYLDPEFEQSILLSSDAINADVDIDLSRLRRRGIRSNDGLVEAFIAEHRGSQYINAQLLSLRAHVDVAVPFAMRNVLEFVSRVPMQLKIHNLLNQRMLRRHAPRLLDFPLAATLVPAGAPLFLQELSRLARGAYERGRSALYEGTRGAITPPRLGWVNFAFLRSGEALSDLMDDLQCDYWDRRALERRLKAVATAADIRQLHPLYDQLAKVYTVDLICR